MLAIRCFSLSKSTILQPFDRYRQPAPEHSSEMDWTLGNVLYGFPRSCSVLTVRERVQFQRICIPSNLHCPTMHIFTTASMQRCIAVHWGVAAWVCVYNCILKIVCIEFAFNSQKNNIVVERKRIFWCQKRTSSSGEGWSSSFGWWYCSSFGGKPHSTGSTLFRESMY